MTRGLVERSLKGAGDRDDTDAARGLGLALLAVVVHRAADVDAVIEDVVPFQPADFANAEPCFEGYEDGECAAVGRVELACDTCRIFEGHDLLLFDDFLRADCSVDRVFGNELFALGVLEGVMQGLRCADDGGALEALALVRGRLGHAGVDALYVLGRDVGECHAADELAGELHARGVHGMGGFADLAGCQLRVVDVLEIAFEGPGGAQLTTILDELLGFLLCLRVGALELLGLVLLLARRVTAVLDGDTPQAATFALALLHLDDGVVLHGVKSFRAVISPSCPARAPVAWS